MKKILAGLSVAVLLLLSASCASAYIDALQQGETIAVLGYNTSLELDQRQLEGFIKLKLTDVAGDLDFKLGTPKREFVFPMTDKVNPYANEFEEILGTLPYTVLDKDTVVNSGEYGKIPPAEPVDAAALDKMTETTIMAPAAVAEGYRYTYKYNEDDWWASVVSDKAEVPIGGSLVNIYSPGLLEDLGADIGIVVAQTPYIATHDYGLINLDKNKKAYFAVAMKTTYFIIVPGSVVNKVIRKEIILEESQTRYERKGYTMEMKEDDQKTYMDQLDEVSRRSHQRFVQWLSAVRAGQ